MDCKDLMIGDWVICNDLKMQVAVIGETVGFLDCNNQVYWAYEGFDRIYPIPITGEILVKNGLKKQEANEWCYYKEQDGKGQFMILWSMDYNYLEIGSYTNAYGEFERFGVCYVHQLQHALRLCGIDMEIKL